MLEKAFNNGHGQWLAVVSGRFLPVRDISISVENDIDMVASSSTRKNTSVQSARETTTVNFEGRETITVKFETGCDPMLQDLASRKPEHIVLVNRKHELLVHESTVFITGNTIAEELIWSLEVDGLNYELRER